VSVIDTGQRPSSANATKKASIRPGAPRSPRASGLVPSSGATSTRSSFADDDSVKKKKSSFNVGRKTLLSSGSPSPSGNRKKRPSGRQIRASDVGRAPRVGESVLQDEIGEESITLLNLFADGGVWSSRFGLYVDRSIRSLTRLPPLRVRIATPRAAEYALHQQFGQSHGCLELPVQRVLRSPWPIHGAVSGSLEAEEILQLRLPFVWGDTIQMWHPATLYDAVPPRFTDDAASLLFLPESGGEKGGAEIDTAGSGKSKQKSIQNKQQSMWEGGLRPPMLVSRPFSHHPAAAPGLVASWSSTTSAPAKNDMSPEN